METLVDKFETFGKFGPESVEGLGNYVFIERDPEKTKTAGGLHIPEVSQEMIGIGTVVAVGEGKKDKYGAAITPDFKVGDKVAFHKWGGYESVFPNGKLYWMFEHEEILSKVDPTVVINDINDCFATSYVPVEKDSPCAVRGLGE